MSYEWYMNDRMANTAQTYPLGTYRLIGKAGIQLNVLNKGTSI